MLRPGDRGDRPQPANRFDPMHTAMVVIEPDDPLDRRSNSAIATQACALLGLPLTWRRSRLPRYGAFIFSDRAVGVLSPLIMAAVWFALTAGRSVLRGHLGLPLSSHAASCCCCAGNPLVPVAQSPAAASWQGTFPVQAGGHITAAVRHHRWLGRCR
jgi:hypothetical protein